jgi:hypothetical protein
MSNYRFACKHNTMIQHKVRVVSSTSGFWTLEAMMDENVESTADHTLEAAETNSEFFKLDI